MKHEGSILDLTTPEIVATFGERFKDYRIACDMTQKEVADKSGVSVITIRKFENGRLYNLSLAIFIALLKAIDFAQGLDEVLPEIPVSPYELLKIQQGKRKRVRHAK